MMNEEKFELTISDLAGSGTYYADIADELRARDTAQLEALARVEAERDFLSRDSESTRLHANHLQAQLAEAVVLLGWSKYQLMLWEDHQVENGFEVEDHYVTGKVREEVEAFLARHAQAEQQDDGRTCRFCLKRFDSAGECGNHVDQFHHGESGPAAHGDEAVLWVPCSERLPEVAQFDQQEFIVSVQRKDKVITMSALYLNEYPLYCEDYDDADDEGYVPHTGWYDAKSNGDDANCYTLVNDSWYGSTVTHWMPMPKPAAAMRAQAGKEGE